MLGFGLRVFEFSKTHAAGLGQGWLSFYKKGGQAVMEAVRHVYPSSRSMGLTWARKLESPPGPRMWERAELLMQEGRGCAAPRCGARAPRSGWAAPRSGAGGEGKGHAMATARCPSRRH